MAKENEGAPAAIESRKIMIGNEQAHYLKAGSGPPVVLIHGGASDSRDWAGTMAALASRYTLYAPDLIGFGQSERSREGYYLSDLTSFTLGFLEALDLDAPVLVGHSMGGRVCLDIALKHPGKVLKLVLVDAAGFGPGSRWGTLLMTFFWLARKLLGMPQPYPKFLAREGENWVYADDLPRLSVPTLIIWKRYDPYLPLAQARRAGELIPEARLVVLPGYGHAPHEQNREAFRKLLEDFMDHA